MYLELEFPKIDRKFEPKTHKNHKNRFEPEENQSDWSWTGRLKAGAKPINGSGGPDTWRMGRVGRNRRSVEMSTQEQNDVSFVTLENDVVWVKTTCHFCRPRGKQPVVLVAFFLEPDRRMKNYFCFSSPILRVLLEGCKHLISHVIPYLRHDVLAQYKIWHDNANENVIIPVITSPTSLGINFTYCMSSKLYCHKSQSFGLFMRIKLWINAQVTRIITCFSIGHSGASLRILNIFFKTPKVLSTQVLNEKCV